MTESFPADYKGWLAKLIAFNTVSRNSNLPLILYIQDYLKTVGIESTLVHNPDKTKANLWATLPGENGATKGGLVLSGHTDVVPTDGQKWDTDPFTMVEKDGKLYGRGSCDMKGFIAIVMSLTPFFLNMKRSKPIHYAFSFDEELGCKGIPFLMDYLKERQFAADACIVGEPTCMKVTTANKGAADYKMSVHGKPIHTSMALMNTSCNAIEHAAKIIVKIREIALNLREHGDQDPEYSCPFSCMSTVKIDGGIATNIVPELCSFQFNVRIKTERTVDRIDKELDSFIAKEVLPEMKKEYDQAKINKEKLIYIPFNGSEDNVVTREARRLCNDHQIHKMGALTEAGYFQAALNKVPTVILGPGSINIAHQPNEYVPIEEMEQCVNVLKSLSTLLCSSASVHI